MLAAVASEMRQSYLRNAPLQRHFLFIGIVIAAVTPKATADTLNVGEILEVRFSTTAPVCPNGACDVLWLSWTGPVGFFSATDFTANLFDGNSLLGTYFNTGCCFPTFQSPTSVFGAGSATVDFTAINSGTINGILDMSIATGYLIWPSAPTLDLLIGHSPAPNTANGGTGLQVDSVTILPTPIPEPSYIALLLGGVVFLGLWHRLRAKTRRALNPAPSLPACRN
jgi:hypothetical protein